MIPAIWISNFWMTHIVETAKQKSQSIHFDWLFCSPNLSINAGIRKACLLGEQIMVNFIFYLIKKDCILLEVDVLLYNFGYRFYMS